MDSRRRRQPDGVGASPSAAKDTHASFVAAAATAPAPAAAPPQQRGPPGFAQLIAFVTSNTKQRGVMVRMKGSIDSYRRARVVSEPNFERGTFEFAYHDDAPFTLGPGEYDRVWTGSYKVSGPRLRCARAAGCLLHVRYCTARLPQRVCCTAAALIIYLRMRSFALLPLIGARNRLSFTPESNTK